jgi:murein DD-endopeptidase MepM/ murein hydrolase activator NlpD
MNKKRLLVLLPAVIIAVLIVRDFKMKKISDSRVSTSPRSSDMTPVQSQNVKYQKVAPISNVEDKFQPPLERAGERVTKKPFGIFIYPRTSKVQPERFQGYHTGVDFEIFPEELDQDIPIYAITSGKILVKRSATSYGGVLVESAKLDNSPATIIYGHLSLSSIGKNVGDSLTAGEQIGFLGKNKSPETDGERKHLHLGIHKGSEINIRGYASSKEELSGWIDFMASLSANSK